MTPSSSISGRDEGCPHGPHAPAKGHGPSAPSPWVVRFAGMVPAGGTVLDVACGAGRHTRFFLERGHPVLAIDIDTSAMNELAGRSGLELVRADLEDGNPFPLGDRRFAAVVVTRYLYRPLLPALVRAVAPGGVLIYETFAMGNERFGRPRNPAHLARPGELLDAARECLRIVAYEDVILEAPKPAAVQRLCAINDPNAEKMYSMDTAPSDPWPASAGEM